MENDKAQLNSGNLDSKDRKYQNLQSSVFGGGYIEQDAIQHDRDAKKVAYTSTSGWMDEASKKAPINGFGKQDAYKVK